VDKMGAIMLSVVVPVYNEQEVLPEFHRRLSAVLDSLPIVAEVIYVNDGSRDLTLEQLRRLKDLDGRVTLVDLSRNFGKEIAMTAGLDHAMGEAVVIIDADLQDPPELIPRLLEEMETGSRRCVCEAKLSSGGDSAEKVQCLPVLSIDTRYQSSFHSRRHG
jgi:polyisoprenyl-phosphate glycosyltransferase